MVYNSDYAERIRKDFGNSKVKTIDVALLLPSLSGTKKLLKKCLQYGDTQIKIIFKKSYKFLNIKPTYSNNVKLLQGCFLLKIAMTEQLSLC